MICNYIPQFAHSIKMLCVLLGSLILHEHFLSINKLFVDRKKYEYVH